MKRSNENPTVPTRVKSVLVVYETPAVRELAVRFCDQLSERHRSRARLEITWWSFAFLNQPVMATDAGRRALEAELVVFAMLAAGDFPGEIKLWIEQWLARRHEREGAMIGLTERESRPGEIASLKEIYLRHVAHSAGMDYLSHASPTAARAIPNSLDSFNQRAGQVTSVLDEILRAQSNPTPPL
jgi:hypothetical protein